MVPSTRRVVIARYSAISYEQYGKVLYRPKAYNEVVVDSLVVASSQLPNLDMSRIFPLDCAIDVSVDVISKPSFSLLKTA